MAWVYAAIAFSGLTALGAEVVWTRLLSLLLGATVYTFSIILAVFLAGLWVGSGAGSFLARRVRDPRLALAGCQILLAVAIAWTAFTLAHVLPWWPVDPWLADQPLDQLRSGSDTRASAPFSRPPCCGAPAFHWPWQRRLANREDPGRLTGEVYAANTAGSIVGALAFSLLLIPAVGTQSSQQVLIWLAAAAAVVAVAPVFLRMRARRSRDWRWPGHWLARRCWRGACRPPSALFPGRRSLMAGAWRLFCGAWIPPSMAQTSPVFVGEGINSSVVITQRGDQKIFLCQR